MGTSSVFQTQKKSLNWTDNEKYTKYGIGRIVL